MSPHVLSTSLLFATVQPRSMVSTALNKRHYVLNSIRLPSNQMTFCVGKLSVPTLVIARKESCISLAMGFSERQI